MTDRETLGQMEHTNPYTGESFGETQTYGRGRMIAADGGEASAASPDEDDDADEDTTLRDVDHTPREGAPSANAAYDRDDGANEEGATAAGVRAADDDAEADEG